MTSQKRSRVARVEYLLFVLSGFLLGYAAASVVIPDEPAVGRALGTATIGLCGLIIAQQAAKEDKPTSDE